MSRAISWDSQAAIILKSYNDEFRAYSGKNLLAEVSFSRNLVMIKYRGLLGNFGVDTIEKKQNVVQKIKDQILDRVIEMDRRLQAILDDMEE